jgi:hypothetical protein
MPTDNNNINSQIVKVGGPEVNGKNKQDTEKNEIYLINDKVYSKLPIPPSFDNNILSKLYY